jgi:hypothetical protein
VLEDDNYLEPHFITDNLRLMAEHDVKVVLRNQFIFWDDEQGWRDAGETCRSGFFEEGIITRESMMPHLPFHCGISNGGLMWAVDCVTDWFVGPLVENSSHQEILRTFQLREPIWFAEKSMAWFRAERKGGGTSRWGQLTAMAATQSIARASVRLGPADYWETATRLAERHGHHGLLEWYGLLCGHRMPWRTMSPAKAMLRRMKLALCAWLPVNPLAAYWRAFAG